MKKILSLMLGVAAMFASCSQSEEFVTQNNNSDVLAYGRQRSTDSCHRHPALRVGHLRRDKYKRSVSCNGVQQQYICRETGPRHIHLPFLCRLWQ